MRQTGKLNLSGSVKFVWILLFCIFSACNDLSINQSDSLVITALYTNEIITIDGQLSEQIWQTSDRKILKVNKTGESVRDSTQQTWVRTAYDNDNLYVSFECNDADIWGTYDSRDQHLWQEEAVEVFIDTDQESHTYTEIEVSPRNILFDSFIVDPFNIDIEATKKYDLPGIQTAVDVEGTLDNRTDRDTSWTVEMAIPFKDIYLKDTPITTSTRWKINFYRINRDQDNESTGYAWSPTRARFHQPSAFGTLQFENKTSEEL
jgi:hypothetical protein